MTEHVEPDGLMMEARALPPETSFAGAGKAASGSWTGGWPNIPDTSGPPPTALQEPAHWVYDFDPTTGLSRATFSGVVVFTGSGGGSGDVTSFNGRTGDVVLIAADVTGAGGALSASPAFTGNPTAPTPAVGNNSTAIATTAFVAQAIANAPIVDSFNGRTGNVILSLSDITTAGGAPAASPAFTGNPQAPTPAVGNASGAIATTQFVANALGSTVVSFNGRVGAVNLTLSDVQSVGGAPIASPSFSGTPTAATAAANTSTTQLATTAFVMNAVQAATTGVVSFNSRQGVVALTAADVSGVGGALLAGPAFTGSPSSPTPPGGDNSTRIATTAFVGTAVQTAITDLGALVDSFNGRTGSVTLLATDITSAGGALTASPTFTGSPLAPTPPGGDNSTRLATTAFVTAGFVTPAQVTAQLGGYLPLSGGTLTGELVLAGPPVNANDAATKAYVDSGSFLPLSGGALTGALTGTSISMSGSIQGATTIVATNSFQTGATGQVIIGNGTSTFNGAMRFNAYNVGMGTTGVGSINNATSANFSASGIVSESSVQAFWGNKLGGNGSIMVCGQGGVACGSITVANASSTAFNTSSDGRLKTDRKEFDPGEIIDALELWDFQWILPASPRMANGQPAIVFDDPPIRGHGVIAQDAIEIFPEAITHDADRDTWGADYSKFVPLLLREVQLLRARVAVLEAA